MAAASAAHATLVRPDEEGPTTSETWPRGSATGSSRAIQAHVSALEWRNRVFAQTVGQCRGESAVEFSVSEKGFDGGFGGHIHLNFAKLSPL